VSQSILICSPAPLPDHLHIEAADRAGRINGANRPQLAPGVRRPPPARLAAMTGKFWAAGQTLTWMFMDGADPATRKLMAAAYDRWAQWVNLVFQETQDPTQAIFRWTRGSGGYYSMIGTDCGMIPHGEATGNLEGFNSRTRQDEWHRVADHEIGHGLGFGHTQLLPEIVNRIDPEAAYRYFGGSPNFWPRSVTKSNVLEPYRRGEVTLANVQLTSVMMYGLPAEIMKDGVAIPGGSGITPEDGQTAAKIYPGRVPVVPPPKPGGPLPLVLGTPTSGKIDFPGERDQYGMDITESGTYTVSADPPMEIGIYAGSGTGKVIVRGYEVPPSAKLKTGKFTVKVMHHLSRGTGPYTLTAAKVS
jgi:hypothetical protein